jgi:cell division protein FtsW
MALRATTMRLETPVAARRTDRVLFSAVVALLALGVLLVTTSSAAISLDRFDTPHHYLGRHLLHLCLGAAALATLWLLDYRKLDRPEVVHALFAVVLVLLIACLFEAPAGGARRWVRWGALAFQPSELAKIAVILSTAFQLSRRQDRLADPWEGLLPALLFAGQLAVLVAIQPDFGTAASLFAIFGVLAVVAGTPWRILAGHAAVAVIGLGAFLVQEPYRVQRLRAFVDGAADPLGAGFQLNQSLIAVGTGGLVGRTHDGLLGTGLGSSLQKLFFLPEPHTDFAFAVLAEELGLLGSLAVVALFTLVLIRGLRIAAAAATAFGSLVATGATCILACQALVNILVVVGLLPTKGLPLPFLSAGGSSLVISCMAAGILLSVSRHG